MKACSEYTTVDGIVFWILSELFVDSKQSTEMRGKVWGRRMVPYMMVLRASLMMLFMYDRW